MTTPTSLAQVRLPYESVNYALNPSCEDGTTTTPTNASAVATATISRQTTYSRQVTPDSNYSYKVVTLAANDGLQLTTAALPSASIYMSAWVYVTAGTPAIRFKCNATTLTPTLYETDGGWRFYVTDDTPWTSGQAGGQTAVQVLDATGSATFYVDDVVVQASAWTTSFHGSYPGCRWNGIAHQSTSTLYKEIDGAPNLAAGQIWDLQTDYLAVPSLAGMGLPEIEALEQKTVDRGTVFQAARLAPRTMILQGYKILASSQSQLHSRRATLIDYVAPGEKFIFRLRTNPTYKGGTADVYEGECHYLKGAEGNLRLPTFEEMPLTLKMSDPLFRSGAETATALTMATSATLSYAIRRQRLEGWDVPGGGLGPNVLGYALAASPKGHIFAGGTGGSDNLRGWDGSSWADCGVMTGTKDINALAFDPSGTVLYVGGAFTNMGGVACNNIAKYTLPATGTSGGTWSALGGTPGTNGRVRAIVTVPTATGHDVYAFGEFTQAGGASANYAAKWTGSAWSTLGPNAASASGYVRSAVYDGSNYIYLGGDFTTLGTLSTPSAPAVANTTGSLASGTWTYKILLRTNSGRTAISSASALGTNATGKTLTLPNTTGSTHIEIFRSNSSGGGGTHFYLTTVPRGTTSWTDDGSITLNLNVSETLYTTATDGTRTKYVGKYSIADNCFEYEGQSGMNAAVKALALAADGVTLYAGGSFGTADGVAANRVAQCNGYIWSALGDNDVGGGVSGGDVEALRALPTGEIAVGGAFTGLVNSQVGTLGANLAYWWPAMLGGAGTWTPSDVVFPGSTTVYSLMLDHNSNLWAGFNTTGSGTTSAQTTVTTSGTAGAFLNYPRVYVQGPGTLRYLANATTGQALWFNLPVGVDEVITIDLRRGYKSITTNLAAAPRVSKYIAGDLGDFGLRSGGNRLRCLMTGTSGNAAVRVADPGLRISADK